MEKNSKPYTTDELFLEFSTTQSPFERWELFRHFTDDAQLIYLPNHKQSFICNFQFGLFEIYHFGKENERANAQKLILWLMSHKEHVVNEIGTASPNLLYESLSTMTPAQVALCAESHKSYLLAFNPARLTFKKPSAWSRLIEKLRR